MHANHAYLPHLATPRYRALGIVMVVHLALGWWLLQGVAPLEQQIRRSPLAPVLIQDVMIVSPAPALQPSAKSPPQPQPPVRPPEAFQQQSVTKPPARGAPRPDPVRRPAAPQVRDVRPDATVSPQTLPATPTPSPSPSPMASPVMPSAPQDPGAAGVPGAGHPASSFVAMPSATPVSGLAKSGPVTPLQPRASVPTGPAAGAGAASADIALVCPTQVAPVMPRLAVRGGITGVVQAQAVIVDGVVRDVRILSGPPIFQNAVRIAMRQYRCESRPSEVLVTQTFIFKVD